MASHARSQKEHTRERGNGSRENGSERMENGKQSSAGPSANISQNPISNLMYDWLTILQSKAEAITAYEKYMRDAEEMGDTESMELFHKLHEQDVWQVKEIKEHLENLMFSEGEE
jgi:hypothetical protein